MACAFSGFRPGPQSADANDKLPSVSASAAAATVSLDEAVDEALLEAAQTEYETAQEELSAEVESARSALAEAEAARLATEQASEDGPIRTPSGGCKWPVTDPFGRVDTRMESPRMVHRGGVLGCGLMRSRLVPGL